MPPKVPRFASIATAVLWQWYLNCGPPYTPFFVKKILGGGFMFSASQAMLLRSAPGQSKGMRSLFQIAVLNGAVLAAEVNLGLYRSTHLLVGTLL